MKEKYTIQKYAYYNTIHGNIIEYNNSYKFLINYVNTIIYYCPNRLKIILDGIKYDITEYNDKYNGDIDEYYILNVILENLDVNNKLYSRNKKIIERRMYKILREFDLVTREHNCFNFFQRFFYMIIFYLCIIKNGEHYIDKRFDT